jgi:ribose transport system ATP-binding protein
MSISLSAQNVVKRYGGVVALSDGNLEVRSGEVVALLGANGSGKSTLSKIITGVAAPNGGQLLVDDRPVQFSSPQAAHSVGITAVYQELSLIPDMTVAENIFLTHEPLIAGGVRRRVMAQKARDLIALFEGCTTLRPDTIVRTLPPTERQIVEILKAISLDPRLIILDEATASLDLKQVDRLVQLVQGWKESGKAIVFVSHRMDEIFRIADRATVLRNGKTVGDVRIADTDKRELIRMMIGDTNPIRESKASYTGTRTHLRVQNLYAGDVNGVSFAVRDGELLGIGGLQGQGQADLLLALFGAIPYTGSITLADDPAHFRHPRQAMRRGVAFVPGDRGSEGLLLIRSILENLHLPSWGRFGVPLNMARATAEGARQTEELRVVMSSLSAPVNSLSGGNAQKIVIGKWLLRNPNLLLLNDPTKGVDVGAKAEFYALLGELRKRGTAIIFYSSDDEELLGLCDRVLVLHDGEICAELSGETLERIWSRQAWEQDKDNSS